MFPDSDSEDEEEEEERRRRTLGSLVSCRKPSVPQVIYDLRAPVHHKKNASCWSRSRKAQYIMSLRP